MRFCRRASARANSGPKSHGNVREDRDKAAHSLDVLVSAMESWRSPVQGQGLLAQCPAGSTVYATTDTVDETLKVIAQAKADKVRRYGEFAYAAKTWSTERRVIARVEATARGRVPFLCRRPKARSRVWHLGAQLPQASARPGPRADFVT